MSAIFSLGLIHFINVIAFNKLSITYAVYDVNALVFWYNFYVSLSSLWSPNIKLITLSLSFFTKNQPKRYKPNESSLEALNSQHLQYRMIRSHMILICLINHNPFHHGRSPFHFSIKVHLRGLPFRMENKHASKKIHVSFFWSDSFNCASLH